ncbi:MFS transporter [Chitinophaga deserti]|uniref:MFS transporter n=1 Tax=Chitinophaga deserti TaxID=2164099 RepID=UPI000D6BE75E|nr:MFS transporter [Chitinophaga deserti]
MKPFYAILINSIVAGITNTFVWFAVTFWVYLETRSVLATSWMAGIYIGTVAVSGFYLGSLVDHYKKKHVMMLSSIGSLVCFALAGAVYAITPPEAFKHADSPMLWVFIVLALMGALSGNLRYITLPTVVTILVPEDKRDKANGMVGTANGTAFLVASVFSGLAIGLLGIFWTMAAAVAGTLLCILHLWFVKMEETLQVESHSDKPRLDVNGTIRIVRQIPGLFGLIFFNTFNNFLGGVFMALMDPYGLSLVSVEVWGTLWGVLSLGFIVGGITISKTGLGKQPVRTLFTCNIVMWTICIFFALQASIVLLAVGMFAYLCLIPVVEAAEQTIIQKVIPLERQGRVFGFAQSIEQAASPLTAIMIGPVAHFFFIPFMTTGQGADILGPWFGTGLDRGIALLFTLTGLVGLMVTLIAKRTRAYSHLLKIA